MLVNICTCGIRVNESVKFSKPTFVFSPAVLPFSIYPLQFFVVCYGEISRVSSAVLASIPKNSLGVALEVGRALHFEVCIKLSGCDLIVITCEKSGPNKAGFSPR